MIRTPRQDVEGDLQDLEYVKLYGAAQAKAEFAITLAKARRMSEITQQELADKLGLSQPYIAKLEGGDANPTLGTTGSILAVLGHRLAMDIKPLLPSLAISSKYITNATSTGIPELDKFDDSNAFSVRPTGSEQLVPITA